MTAPNKLYLLMHASGRQFKIGIAVQTHMRARNLPDDIDLARSLEAVVTTGSAKKVESILHYLFRDLSQTEERVRQGNTGDGYTEWFDIEGFDQARAIIETHASLLGVSSLRPVELPAPKSRMTRPVDEGMSPRQVTRWNRNADWELDQMLRGLEADGSLLGLSVDQPHAGGPVTGATLYLRGEQAADRIDRYIDDHSNSLIDQGGRHRHVFTSYVVIDPPSLVGVNVDPFFFGGSGLGHGCKLAGLLLFRVHTLMVKEPWRLAAVDAAAKALEEAQRASHDKWFREQVAEAVAEADAPGAEWIPHEVVKADMAKQRAALQKRIEGLHGRAGD